MPSAAPRLAAGSRESGKPITLFFLCFSVSVSESFSVSLSFLSMFFRLCLRHFVFLRLPSLTVSGFFAVPLHLSIFVSSRLRDFVFLRLPSLAAFSLGICLCFSPSLPRVSSVALSVSTRLCPRLFVSPSRVCLCFFVYIFVSPSYAFVFASPRF